MVFIPEKAVVLLVLMLLSPCMAVVTLLEGQGSTLDELSAEGGRTAEFIAGWQAPISMPGAVKSGYGPSGSVDRDPVSADLSDPGRSTRVNSTPHPLPRDVPLPGHSGLSQTPHGAFTRDVPGGDPVCSNGETGAPLVPM